MAYRKRQTKAMIQLEGYALFTEFFATEQWQPVMPGIDACVFNQLHEKTEIPVLLKTSVVEAVFCVEGSAVIHRRNGTQIHLNPKEILLVSDCSGIQSGECRGNMKGLCLSVNTSRAGQSLQQLCGTLGGLSVSTKQVGQTMQSLGGVHVVTASPWSRATFYTLKTIAREDWGQYGVLKCFELLYLMCKQNSGAEPRSAAAGANGYLSGIAANMKGYMEEHLDEKLTILDLSRKFHLSRTACKSCFRACYGQPIHSWILDRRMEQATDLLEHTNMPVLQIAQAVGYSGVSQFNAAFKQRYGKTPREYRKMSVSGCF